MNVRASGAWASLEFFFSHFHILPLLFPSIFYWYTLRILYLRNIHILRSQIASAYIYAVSFYYLLYGAIQCMNDSIPKNTNIERIYYASERA